MPVGRTSSGLVSDAMYSDRESGNLRPTCPSQSTGKNSGSDKGISAGIVNNSSPDESANDVGNPAYMLTVAIPLSTSTTKGSLRDATPFALFF